jgi:hypothetical protein
VAKADAVLGMDGRVMYNEQGYTARGPVAQLGERCVRNAEVEGSIPFGSTTKHQLEALPSGRASAFVAAMMVLQEIIFHIFVMAFS